MTPRLQSAAVLVGAFLLTAAGCWLALAGLLWLVLFPIRVLARLIGA